MITERGLHEQVIDWYDEHARDLPWRRPEATAWGVLVSEFMLQQTQVDRVLPAYAAWLARWPTPADLAAAATGEAVRQWGRLGYPRRALRLHAAASAIVAQHGGAVPSSYDDLRELPGVGDYTAAAVASFAFGARHAVLDTNVRRVLGRLVGGEALPAPAVTAGERARAVALLPDDGTAARWAVATMELGALVCTSRAPRCETCPVRDVCRWRLAGSPPYAGPTRRGQRYEGTDRQARGRILAVLCASSAPVAAAELGVAAGPDPIQVSRALASLVADRLVERVADGSYTLPGPVVAADECREESGRSSLP
jgi:A/G-specific adenine glycosylase